MSDFEPGRITVINDPEVTVTFDPLAGLQMLREKFPPELIEKLPKPLWKGAWDGERAARCEVCHGYHVLSNCIHLDFVGHANCTNRLLEADPYWDWEPLAYTEQGLPQFDKVGGLWIKLTVCGVTRLGYGDGATPKEIIGDAIRNAAMRFGVALDLWSKADLHADRNPGDGPTSQQRNDPRNTVHGSRDSRGSEEGNRPQRDAGQADAAVAADPASNQDALDALQSVCDEHGYSIQYCIDRFFSDHDKHIRIGTTEEILLFAEELADEATAEPADPEPADSADDTAVVVADATVGEASTVDPEDTSDVEKGPDDIF